MSDTTVRTHQTQKETDKKIEALGWVSAETEQPNWDYGSEFSGSIERWVFLVKEVIFMRIGRAWMIKNGGETFLVLVWFLLRSEREKREGDSEVRKRAMISTSSGGV